MARLETGFEQKATDAFQQAAVDGLYGERGNVVFEFIQTVNENFQRYARANGYDIDHIWQDVEVTDAQPTATGARARIEWPGLTGLFEYGVSPHTIDGNPLLHFYWEEADQWVQTESVDWGSETGGIPEARAIRNGLRSLRASLQRRGPGGRFV